MEPPLDTKIRNIPTRSHILFKGDEAQTPYQEDAVLKGDPEAVIRPRDLKDIQTILEYCHHHHIPVTFAGGQTSLTGSSVALKGVLIVTEKMTQILDLIKNKKGRTASARVEPGMILGEFKKSVAEQGFFYPPDPTSYNEALIGSTVATNATGDDTLKYGTTRHYVNYLKIILATGKILEVHRDFHYSGGTNKNLGGYEFSNETIDPFIGSEGTLGFLAEVGVKLLSRSPEWFAGLAFFPDVTTALECVTKALKSSKVSPRALELLDRASLDIIKKIHTNAPFPPENVSCIYFKQEFEDPEDQTTLLDHWWHLIKSILKDHHASLLADKIIIFESPQQKEEMRKWRHAVPSWINEMMHQHHPAGGGKVSSDWWVPADKITTMMSQVKKDNEELGIPTIYFGHIGNGHPHINYLAKNNREKELAETLIVHHSKRAVQFGGGVAGEHGLGKIYRHLLSVQHSTQSIKKMMDLKKHYDPHWILGRETLFSYPGQ